MSIQTTNFETSALLSLNCRIGVIVACRLKSSRLKQKAILPIRGIASVERCLQNCLLIAKENPVVLATSTLPDDAKLENFTLGGRVKFWKGHPDDVIQRYLGACAKFGIDVIVRVTADCPVVSPEIADFLLKSHFESGADYTAPRNYAVGTNSEIYNTEALQRVIDLLGQADHSEYMTWYMRNNPDVFKVNIIDLPEDLLRDYRLTLDFPEDLEMFERLYAQLEQRDLTATVANVFSILDEDNGIAGINSHLTLRYQADAELIEKLNKATRIVAK